MKPFPAPELISNSTLAETIQSVVFPSGLRVLFCPKPGFKKRYACYSAFYGSVDNEFILAEGRAVKVPDGVAHFLEHTLFETAEGNVSALFAKNGAYNNAATSFTTTTYLFACTSHFYENLELLVRFVENPAFRPETVEKERGIIEQEIKGYDDNPSWVSYLGLLENLFERHPIRVDIAGTVESIRKIDAEILHTCHRAFYHPANMILFVIGDLNPEELFSFVAEKSKAAGARSTGWPVRRIYPEEPCPIFRRETRKRMEVGLPKILLGFKDVGVPMTGEAFLLRELASDLALEILFGHSSDTFRELYESQLIFDDFSTSYTAGSGIGYGLVGGDTPAPDKLRDVLLGRISTLLERGLDGADFEREKRRFMGGFIRAFNSLEYIASHYTHYRFHGFDLFRAIECLVSLGRECLEERVRELLDPENYASFVILPK